MIFGECIRKKGELFSLFFCLFIYFLYLHTRTRATQYLCPPMLIKCPYRHSFEDIHTLDYVLTMRQIYRCWCTLVETLDCPVFHFLLC